MRQISITTFCNMSYKERYTYTLTCIKEKQNFWVFQNPNGHYPLNEAFDGGDEFVIWSEESFAQYNQSNEWANTITKCLTVPYFIETMADKMKKRNIKILLSPMGNLRGKVLTIESFIEYIAN